MDAVLLHKAFLRQRQGEAHKEPPPWCAALVALVFGLPAAYLSWTSNGIVGWSMPMKVLFALAAFLFSLEYLPAHMLHKADLLARVSVGSG